MNRRITKAERYELGEGKACSIAWAPIIVAGISAASSYLSSRNRGGGGQQRVTESNVPQWSPHQMPYLFSGDAWQPQMPLWNPYAINYAGGLMGGYNPAYGPQGPQGFGGILAGLGDGGQDGSPWYQDPNANQQQGGLQGLLGFGQGMPPPSLMNSPFFGHGVANPELLHRYPGSDISGQGRQQQGEEQQGGQAPRRPPWERPQPRTPLGRDPYGDPFANWWDESLRDPNPGMHHLSIGNARRSHDAFLSSLSGRNIADLTEEERAWLNNPPRF